MKVKRVDLRSLEIGRFRDVDGALLGLAASPEIIEAPERLLDAGVLLPAELGPVAAGDPRLVGRCDAIACEQRRIGRIMRCTGEDDFDARETGALWGNIPRSYSIAGIVNSALRLSVRWEDVSCRASS